MRPDPERGLEALDRALAIGGTPSPSDPLGEATACVATLRDVFIERQRAGHAGADVLLRQANALLSELVAAEFPLAGVRRERIQDARESLARLLTRLDTQGGQAK